MKLIIVVISISLFCFMNSIKQGGGFMIGTGVNTNSGGIFSGTANQFISNYNGGGDGNNGGGGNGGYFWRTNIKRVNIKNDSKENRAKIMSEIKSIKMDLFGDEKASLDEYNNNKHIYNKENLERIAKITYLLEIEEEIKRRKELENNKSESQVKTKIYKEIILPSEIDKN